MSSPILATSNVAETPGVVISSTYSGLGISAFSSSTTEPDVTTKSLGISIVPINLASSGVATSLRP